jgi:hypothetical protein
MEVSDKKNSDSSSLPTSAFADFVSRSFVKIDKDKSRTLSALELDAASESNRLSVDQHAVARLLAVSYDTAVRLSMDENRSEITSAVCLLFLMLYGAMIP